MDSVSPFKVQTPRFIHKHGLDLHTMKWVRIIIPQSNEIRVRTWSELNRLDSHRLRARSDLQTEAPTDQVGRVGYVKAGALSESV